MIQQRIPAARASLPLTAAWPTIKQDSQFVAASLFYQRAENILTSKPVLGAFAVLVLLWLACVAAFAADENLPPNSPIAASSGNVANATATATLAEKAGFLNRICGFQITSGGATAPSLVTATVTGVQGGTLTYTYGAVIGPGTPSPSLVVSFAPCLPATGPGIAISVSLPALGPGNAKAAVSANGYQISISPFRE